MTETIPAAEHTLLTRWLDELARWNQRVNLTTVEPERRWNTLVVGALPLLDHIPSGAAIVDLGTGGGTPAVPIAILRADVTVTCVEADVRKAGFLTHLGGLLGITSLRVLAQRAELLGQQSDHREHFDVATSRAAAPPPVLMELALPLVRVGGGLAALVGDAAVAARESGVAARHCGGGTPWAACPEVLTVRKIAPTPAEFPRRTGVPRRRPLGAES